MFEPLLRKMFLQFPKILSSLTYLMLTFSLDIYQNGYFRKEEKKCIPVARNTMTLSKLNWTFKLTKSREPKTYHSVTIV